MHALGRGIPALLLTVGADGFPNTAYTWVAAPDAQRGRFGVDHGSGTRANLKRNTKAALHIAGPEDLLFLVKGLAKQIEECIEAAPFRISMMEMSVSEVKDQSWAGVTVEPICFQWPEQHRTEMQVMEKAVYAEMMNTKTGV
ncbi:MAG: pyridoxamine 5'-phosphate oxidase family protein [Nitrospinaceae bacterium]|nr:pyridoxamine 5'-phosphate oxidase family protein [Nitrospinaceae bacterium]